MFTNCAIFGRPCFQNLYITVQHNHVLHQYIPLGGMQGLSLLTVTINLTSQKLKLIFSILMDGYVAQAVRRSPPTAGVPSLRPGHSMWVSCWTKRNLGIFFSEFHQFSVAINFIPPFLHTRLIHFVSLHFIHPCEGVSGAVASHRLTRACFGHEFRIFFLFIISILILYS